MSIYSLPKIKFPKIRKSKFFKNKWLVSIVFSLIFGAIGGALVFDIFYSNFVDMNIEIPQEITEDYCLPVISQEETIINVVEKVSPSVVSIIITKDLPIIQEYYYNPFEGFEWFFGEPFEIEIPQYEQEGTEKREIGGGTGFIISKEGLVLTNKHVVSDKEADYTVLTNEGEKFPAKVLAMDPIKDLAIIKIEGGKEFKPVELGDSEILRPGQTVIAIGNALGEFQNTVSTGVVSGLKRSIIAGEGSQIEVLENVIQTDAAINQGNSGGPLLNLKGQVIGVNVAMSQSAENIGFAIPINEAKRDIEQIKTIGKISYPFLGIYYTIITSELKEEYGLSVDYGAWVGRNANGEQTEESTFKGSVAETAGLKEDDIILEFDYKKISSQNSLGQIILNYDAGDQIDLKVLRDNKEIIIPVILGERGSE